MSKLNYLIILLGGALEYLLNALKVKQLTGARAVGGFGILGSNKKKLMFKVGSLSVW